jgi:hypothetical protein
MIRRLCCIAVFRPAAMCRRGALDLRHGTIRRMLDNRARWRADLPAQPSLPGYVPAPADGLMLAFLPPFLRGVVALVALILNTLFWCTPLFILALVKLLIPIPAVRVRIDRVLNAIATGWIACNSGWMRLTQRTQWEAWRGCATTTGTW